MPAGQLDLAGLASYELFFRGALDKIGVFPDLLHIGDYKTASNTFTEKAFTPAHREMTRSLNRDWYDELVRAIAEWPQDDRETGRPRGDRRRARTWPRRRSRPGSWTCSAYEDQLDDSAPHRGHARRSTPSDYANAPARGPSTGDRRHASRCSMPSASIASGESNFDSPPAAVVGSDTFNQWLRKVRVDPGHSMPWSSASTVRAARPSRRR